MMRQICYPVIISVSSAHDEVDSVLDLSVSSAHDEADMLPVSFQCL